MNEEAMKKRQQAAAFAMAENGLAQFKVIPNSTNTHTRAHTHAHTLDVGAAIQDRWLDRWPISMNEE